MAWKQQPLDATLLVVTPENIAFEYRLAGPFRRLPALVLDLCIRAAVVIAMLYLLGYAIFLSAGLAIFVFAILFFIIQWFYCVLFETFFNGQTPGKYILGLRVLSENGQPINGMQATLRNVLGAADIVIGILVI